MNLFKHKQTLPQNPNNGKAYDADKLNKIWLAGGCFWGVQAYFARIPGVYETIAGYANGATEKPTYHDIGKTGHAETLEIRYDADKVNLETLLKYYFKIIDPTVLNRQGNDVGTQYRTGIYYMDETLLPTILSVLSDEQYQYKKPIITEVLPLQNFYPAEEYHQNYLEKNPGGYCHVDFSSLNDPPLTPLSKYQKPDKDELAARLTNLQYQVTQESHTEPPFQNEYWNQYQKGIYVDIVSGQPLFASGDKFESGCGWPSFSKPIESEALYEKKDLTHGMIRTEVRSKNADSHLGHVFTDGPKAAGGLRYCINSAALRFIAFEEMEKEGYVEYKQFVQ